MKSQIKKIIAILLAVCFVSSLTAVAVSAQPTEAKYQDVAWLEYVVKYGTLIIDDFTNIETAANNLDYSALATTSKKTVNDIQKAINENNKYKTSPKFKKAQKEWGAGLQDSKSTTEYLVRIANDAKKGTVNSKNIQKATGFSNAAAAHFNKVSALIEAAGK